MDIPSFVSFLTSCSHVKGHARHTSKTVGPAVAACQAAAARLENDGSSCTLELHLETQTSRWQKCHTLLLCPSLAELLSDIRSYCMSEMGRTQAKLASSRRARRACCVHNQHASCRCCTPGMFFRIDKCLLSDEGAHEATRRTPYHATDTHASLAGVELAGGSSCSMSHSKCKHRKQIYKPTTTEYDTANLQMSAS